MAPGFFMPKIRVHQSVASATFSFGPGVHEVSERIAYELCNCGLADLIDEPKIALKADEKSGFQDQLKCAEAIEEATAPAPEVAVTRGRLSLRGRRKRPEPSSE